jgi:hypothetical protein
MRLRARRSDDAPAVALGRLYRPKREMMKRGGMTDRAGERPHGQSMRLVGNDWAMIYSDVLHRFAVFVTGHDNIFRYIAHGIHVRDEGVAGSNPATPTNFSRGSAQIRRSFRAASDSLSD